MANDVVRRLCRVSSTLVEEGEPEVLNGYNTKLKYSGYKKERRVKILEMGISAFLEKKKRMKNNIHRLEKETREKRWKKKMIGKTSWYKEWAHKPGIFSGSNDLEEGWKVKVKEGERQKFHQDGKQRETASTSSRSGKSKHVIWMSFSKSSAPKRAMAAA